MEGKKKKIDLINRLVPKQAIHSQKVTFGTSINASCVSRRTKSNLRNTKLPPITNDDGTDIDKNLQLEVAPSQVQQEKPKQKIKAHEEGKNESIEKLTSTFKCVEYARKHNLQEEFV